MSTTDLAASPSSHAALDRRFCAAPMLDWSDRHCRVFWRQLSRRAVLYTEMVTTGALLHGDAERPAYLHTGGQAHVRSDQPT